MWSDLRYALRVLRSAPGFTFVAILTLALGIGANVAIFGVFDRVLLRALPYREPGRLVAIQETGSFMRRFGTVLPVTASHFREWRARSRSFEGLALLSGVAYTVTSDGPPERILGGRVSASLFPILGIQAQFGRTFTEEEDRPGHDRVLVISHALWQRRFHGDPEVVGRKVVLDGAPFEVIGVLPPGVTVPVHGQLMPQPFGGSAEFWKPFAIEDSDIAMLAEFNYGCIARLRPGVTREQAAADLNVIQQQIAGTLPEKVDLGATLVPLQKQMTGGARQSLVLLLAASALVLLIVVVNLANLMLARASARQRELAIRTAIGASAGRLVRTTLSESLLLAVVGGALGVALAKVLLIGLLTRAPLDLAGIREVTLDSPVLAFALAVACGCGLFFGILPAWRASRIDPELVLRSGGRGSSATRAGNRVRRLLIAAEVALSAMCLVGAGLLFSSFAHLLHVDKGFETDHGLTTGIGLPAVRYPDAAARIQFVRRLLDRVQSLPGVIAAGVSNRGPLAGEGSNLTIYVEGVNVPGSQRPLTDYRCVTPGFFRAMGIPLVHGRLISEADGDRPVAVVAEGTAKKLWPGQNVIGRRFRLGAGDEPLIEIVGVVGDMRTSLSKAPNLTVYVPFWQRTRGDFSLLVRTAMDPAAVATTLRSAVRRLDPELVVPRFRTFDEIVGLVVEARRFQMDLLLALAFSALLLSALGVYGVVSQAVAQRTGEIGIRMALGATRAQIAALVASQGLGPVAVGLAAGFVGALAAGRLLEGMLFGVAAADPLTFAAVAVTLVGTACVACYVPARRAAKLDPVTALRYE